MTPMRVALRPSRLASVALLAMLVTIATSPTWAHVPPAAAPVVAPVGPAVAPSLIVGVTPAPPPTWLLGGVLALAGLALLASVRRGLRLALVALLAVFLVEAGEHSVHHLADQAGAAACAVALASAQVHGATTECPAEAVRRPVVVARTVASDAVRPAAAPSRPDEGRAPPA